MATSFVLRDLSSPGKRLPPAIPLVLPSHHRWDPESQTLKKTPELERDLDESGPTLELVGDTTSLLQTIHKPLAVLSICGPYRSGKSYFLSRTLGKHPGAFPLGHTMKACTIGMWVATTILECDEYAVLFVDTQGIDAIGSSERVAMNLMALTALLSSYLIYNSKRVPEKVDLDKLRCCSLLSSIILNQAKEGAEFNVAKTFFPKFMWLLRDVALNMTDSSGSAITPTVFLHTRILGSKSKDDSALYSDVGKVLCSFFPSLECRTLPVPSIDPRVLHDIFQQQHKLKPAFNTGIVDVINYILQQVEPKRSIDGRTFLDGPALVQLISTFVKVVNMPNSLPDFQQGWTVLLKLKVEETVKQLVEEYEQEMKESLRENLILEEKDLLRIHENTAQNKRTKLKNMTQEFNLSSLSLSTTSAVETLDRKLAQYDAENIVVSGVLYQFCVRNYAMSKKHCETLWSKLVQSSNIQKKFEDSMVKAVPVDITTDMSELVMKYHLSAIGPAKDEVLEKGRDRLISLSSMLDKLPGKPTDLKIIGVAYDKVKLSWSPPLENPDAAERYIVNACMDGEEWKVLKETSRTKVLITGLLDSAKYKFSVCATNDLLMGLKSKNDVVTKIDNTKEFLLTLASGSVPVIAVVSHCIHSHNRGKDMPLSVMVPLVAASVAVTPATLLGFPLSGPLLATSVMIDEQLEEHSKSWGDLEPEDD